MPHSYSTLLFHVVFSTKDRTPSMDATIRPDLFAYNGTEDHVHMLMSLAAGAAPPQNDVRRGIHRVVA